MTPVPGAGHDYIHLLNETVNPANGSVSVKLNFPMPKGRGISLPFSIDYTSGQVIFQDTFVTESNLPVGSTSVGTKYTGNMGWLSNVGLLSSGGWSYGVPSANWKTWNSSFGPELPPGETCPVTSGYIFSDLTGQAHVLGMGEAGYASGQEGGYSFQCESNSTQGGDDFVSASIPSPPPNSTGYISTPLTVSDNVSGTTYLFGGSLQSQATSNGELRTGLLPYLIEDRNGNQINVTQGFTNQNTGPFAFSFQDTLGRNIVSDAAFQASPDTVAAGGQNYTVTWKTTSASYTVNQSQNVSDIGGNCTPIPAVNDSSLKVISSITLPNGQAYHFYYGNDNPNGVSNPYGLLSEIDYPDGAWVRYTWKLSDTYSDLADYPSGDNQGSTGSSTSAVLADGCQFQYAAPVVATRTVGFGGTTAALQQSFTYSTTWDSQFPRRWDSKSTSVSTTDEVVGETSLKQYTYGYAYGDTAAYTYTNSPPQIPMELTVSSYDWGNTSTPIDVANKAWLDQYELACEFHTQNGTAVSGHFYQYAPGLQVSDDKGYDFGQITNPASVCTGVAQGDYTPTAPSNPGPAREMVRQFQTLTNFEQMSFEEPQSEILYGAGTKVAETDYGYDDYKYNGGTLSPAGAVSHDETHYGPGSTGGRGNLTSISKFINNATAPALTTFGYDETGQVVSKTEPCDRTPCSDIVGAGVQYTTMYRYGDSPAGGNAAGASNAYLTQVMLPLTSPNTGVAHNMSYSYNYTQGLLTESVDENGHATDYSYSDPLMRLTDTYGPPSAQNSNQRPDTHIAYVDGPGATVTTTDPTGVKSVAILDGFGRTVQTQLTTDPSGTDYVDTVYNGLGGTNSVSNPYRSKNDQTYGITSYLYDALGRTTQKTNQDSTTEMWTWLGNTVSFQNENSNVWQRAYDGFGNLIQVIEPATAATNPSTGTDTNPAAETDYQYDAQNNLTRVDQWGGPRNNPGDRVRSFVYDGLSRLTSSTNPESGTISYQYDANSNVQTKTDARGVVTTFNYDTLNRMLSKSYTVPQGVTPAVAATSSISYGYDVPKSGWSFPDQTAPALSGISQQNLVGQLSYESNGNATLVYGYDEGGRTTLKSECTPLTCPANDHFDLHAQYDLAGKVSFADRGLDAQKNAAAPNAGYYYGGLSLGYNTAGQLQSANADIVDANHPKAVLGSLTYTPLGGVYTVELGSAYGQASYYDKRGRLMQRGSVNLAGQTVLADTWGYDNVGNVNSTNDSQQGYFNYSYDSLNRVYYGSGNNATTNYGYDGWGNQTSHTVTAGSSFTWASTPSGQNQLGPSGSGFDASGNMVADGLHNYSYDAESRLAAVVDQNDNLSYLYDPAGVRVAAENGNAVTAEYLYDMDGSLVTTVGPNQMLVRAILRANRTHWGDYTTSTGAGATEFRLVNQAGTLVANGDSQGNFVEGCLSGAFGDGQLCTPSYDYTETHFADKLRDQDTNNDYFGARYYSSTLGRFLSPDWSGTPEPVPYADLTNPQSLNLYSYVKNNPLSVVDPDGHQAAVPFLPPLPLLPQQQMTPQQMGQVAADVSDFFSTLGRGFSDYASEASNAISNVFNSSDSNAPTQPYDTGTANDLKGNSQVGDGLDIHHVPQSQPASQTVQDYDRGSAPAIAVPKAEHGKIPTDKGSATRSPRDQLAKDVRDLRSNTNAPNSQIQKIIEQNKSQYPEMKKP